MRGREGASSRKSGAGGKCVGGVGTAMTLVQDPTARCRANCFRKLRGEERFWGDLRLVGDLRDARLGLLR